jgi:restriction endonuclease Mrr
MARLISRIRHRTFGAFITTSAFSPQAQQEVRNDGHPIALVCGADIVNVLRSRGYTTSTAVRNWLQQRFP